MAALELSPQVFAILGALVEERTGLHYSLQDRGALAERVSARAQEAGFDSLLDYYYFLRYDEGGEEELAALADALVVGETYFFREYAPLEVLVREFLAPWVKAGRRPRIWSAAAATGEEPLTLAMMLDAAGILRDVEIVATDLSQKALARATAGRFSRRSLRAVPEPALAERYLAVDREGVTADARLVRAIQWRRVNLVMDQEVAGLGAFDAILCRNVLIYFSDETTRRVVDRLARAIRDQGVLLVGVSESLARFGSAFVAEEHGRAFVYRKERAR